MLFLEHFIPSCGTLSSYEFDSCPFVRYLSAMWLAKNPKTKEETDSDGILPRFSAACMPFVPVEVGYPESLSPLFRSTPCVPFSSVPFIFTVSLRVSVPPTPPHFIAGSVPSPFPFSRPPPFLSFAGDTRRGSPLANTAKIPPRGRLSFSAFSPFLDATRGSPFSHDKLWLCVPLHSRTRHVAAPSKPGSL